MLDLLGHEIRIGNKQSIDLQRAANMTMAKGGGRGYGGKSQFGRSQGGRSDTSAIVDLKGKEELLIEIHV